MPTTGPVSRLLARIVRPAAALGALALLGGCDLVVMNPMGDVALQQRDLIIFSTVLMLLIVVPVIAAICVFAWRYRASNAEATYSPDWDHSTQLELMIWSAPLLIIIALGAVTWTGSHLLDPYRPIERIARGRPVPAGVKPLEVQAVALDWKWLFIYPEYGFATVNELAAPVDRPIRFRITSSSVMNAFYVPTLAGMIYAMPSMETKLHAVINKPGKYSGRSSNYSGAGYSGMVFPFYGMNDADFAGWVAKNRAATYGGATLSLSRGNYLQLVKPTEKVPVMRFGRVAPGLFDAIVNQCVEPGKTCMNAMMNPDTKDISSMAGRPNSGNADKVPTQDRPLTSAGAGAPAPEKPADAKMRSPADPAHSTTPKQPAL